MDSLPQSLQSLLEAALPLAAAPRSIISSAPAAAPSETAGVAESTVAALAVPALAESTGVDPPSRRHLARLWTRILQRNVGGSAQQTTERARALASLRALLGASSAWEAFTKARSAHLYSACPSLVDWMTRSASVEAIQTLGAVVSDFIQSDILLLNAAQLHRQEVRRLLDEAYLDKYNAVANVASQQSEPGRVRAEVDAFQQRLADQLSMTEFLVPEGIQPQAASTSKSVSATASQKMDARVEIINGDRLSILSFVHDCMLDVPVDSALLQRVLSAIRAAYSTSSLRSNCLGWNSSVFVANRVIEASFLEGMPDVAALVTESFEQLVFFLADAPKSWLLPSLDAAGWQEQRPYLNNTQISPSLVAWWVYLSGVQDELSCLLPSTLATDVFAESFLDVLHAIVTRLMTVKPSRVRLVQLQMDSLFVVELALSVQGVLPDYSAEAVQDVIYSLVGFLAVLSCPLQHLIRFLDDLPNSNHSDPSRLQQICSQIAQQQRWRLCPTDDIVKALRQSTGQYETLRQSIDWTGALVHSTLSNAALVAAAEQRTELRESDYPPLSPEEADLVPQLSTAIERQRASLM